MYDVGSALTRFPAKRRRSVSLSSRRRKRSFVTRFGTSENFAVSRGPCIGNVYFFSRTARSLFGPNFCYSPPRKCRISTRQYNCVLDEISCRLATSKRLNVLTIRSLRLSFHPSNVRVRVHLTIENS